MYTQQAGRKPALQQNWRSSEKSHHFKEKTQYLINTLYKKHIIYQAVPSVNHVLCLAKTTLNLHKSTKIWKEKLAKKPSVFFCLPSVGFFSRFDIHIYTYIYILYFFALQRFTASMPTFSRFHPSRISRIICCTSLTIRRISAIWVLLAWVGAYLAWVEDVAELQDVLGTHHGGGP